MKKTLYHLKKIKCITALSPYQYRRSQRQAG